MRRLLLFFFSHRTLALVRWDLHFVGIRARNYLRFKRWNLTNETSPKFLNLGSGPRGRADRDWLNIDGFNDSNVHMLCDFSRGLPFPAGGFSGIFCEHVLEHFDLEQGIDLLKECFRVLQPQGCLRLIVPDGEKILRGYLDSPAELVARRNNGNPFAIDAVNSYFRQRYEHQYIYDWPMLRHQLETAGFGDVRLVAFGQAVVAPELLLDVEKYAWESLYVEAVKPS